MFNTKKELKKLREQIKMQAKRSDNIYTRINKMDNDLNYLVGYHWHPSDLRDMKILVAGSPLSDINNNTNVIGAILDYLKIKIEGHRDILAVKDKGD